MKRSILLNQRMNKYAFEEITDMNKELSLSKQGLSDIKVEEMRDKYGENVLVKRKNDTFMYRLCRSFTSPFIMILFVLFIVSFLMDHYFLPFEQTDNFVTTPVLLSMIIISGGIRLIQEMRAKKASDLLLDKVNVHVKVCRNGQIQKILVEDLVVGDKVYLHAGERIPADMRFTDASDLFVSQSAITGESGVVEKLVEPLDPAIEFTLANYQNLGFMGTTVMSGHCEAIVLAVGKDTLFGHFDLDYKNQESSFEKTSSKITRVLLKFMLVLIPLIFVILGLSKGDWWLALIFSLSVAIGITPEMLPMVLTTCLAKGSMEMSKKQTLVKDINAMHALGGMDVLCLDKTGTLTNDEILLEYYLDALGNENFEVLDYAFLNSHYHTGAKNPIDYAIEKSQGMPHHHDHFGDLLSRYQKIDEIPFDYVRRTVSILVEDEKSERYIITKGSIDDVVAHCEKAQIQGKEVSLKRQKEYGLREVVDDILEDGLKMIAVAIKKVDANQTHITSDDENDLTLLGYLAFFDAPKTTAREAIHKIHDLNVRTLILTGDNKEVTASVCQRLNIPFETIVTGTELEKIEKDKLGQVVEENDIFAEISPKQKVELVLALKQNNHTVGFLGDGLNDVPALNEADIGITVDNAVDAAQEISEVILLKKDLNVLEQSILEGRKTFVNMNKYIYITASSNFGNILSIICASIFLPFLPISTTQLILLNLFYDIVCIVLPFDNVDEDLSHVPTEWDGKNLSQFMLWFGPLSSLFDIITFFVLYFLICPLFTGGLLFTQLTDPSMKLIYIGLFQAGWFLESLWTQILIIYMLRTQKRPFKESSPSKPVLLVTIIGILGITIFSHSAFAETLGFLQLPNYYYIYLFVIVCCYMILTTIVKTIYIRKNKKLY